ncbi:MAG: UvrD-helicase domain-containing protein [Pseudohongiellaceae bacterium]
MNSTVVDAASRELALDTAISCAVQAPAGSGKTELLSLRFLRLLAMVDEPEEVLAITFTRKAASEMVSRILGNLEWAARNSDLKEADFTSPLERTRHQVSQAVLRHNDQRGWRLLENPGRLRIQTIDSFCLYLASQLPLLSTLGGAPQISEDVDDCYLEAVRNTLDLLNSGEPVAELIGNLLLHLDNDTQRVESMLLNLLARRDQWLGYIIEVGSNPDAAKRSLQLNLTEFVDEKLAQLAECLQSVENELCKLLRFAAGNLSRSGKVSSLTDCLDLRELPPATSDHLPQWLGVAELLTVKSQTGYRKAVNVNTGFPPGSNAEEKATSAEYKALFASLSDTLANEPGLLDQLMMVRRLPLTGFDNEQWTLLTALTDILPTLTAQLSLSFSRHGLVDYSCVSEAAIDALGDDEHPTDLALALDHRISHVLVDEFQDTSNIQNLLLKRLTEGWQPDDGRTLFIVGDGMQSCYGFRNANVGLFIAARQRGLGQTSLTSVDLSTNFRSNAGVVNWVNQIFADAFPEEMDISRGAISYTPATAFSKNDPEAPVRTCLILHEAGALESAREKEAGIVAQTITRLQENNRDQSIAVLVRARRHLEHIIPALHNAGINWQATDIDRLASVPLIQDLLNLTSALAHPGDRLAWLAILRAPWCGLLIPDLHVVAKHAVESSLWSTLQQQAALDALSEDGRQRVEGVLPVLRYGMVYRYRRPWREVIEACWHLLRGPSIAEHARLMECADCFFDLLEGAERSAETLNLARLRHHLQKAFVPGSTTDEGNPVQIMTIHKAKGLEFDHVILPGLSRKGTSDPKSLLLWHEYLNGNGDPRLLLATRAATGNDEDPLYNFLRFERGCKSRLENTRLMYIAVTRARETATLLATLEQKEKESEPAPPEASLLATIWNPLQQLQENIDWCEAGSGDPSSVETTAQSPMQLRRLTTALTLTPSERDLTAVVNTDVAVASGIQDSKPDPMHSEVGNLIHRCLQSYVTFGPETINEAGLRRLRNRWSAQLREFADRDETDKLVEYIESSVLTTTADAELAWVFDNRFEDSRCELELGRISEGRLRVWRLDRSFIDNDNVRWIIDYKSASRPSHQTEEEFVTEQCEKYRGQLTGYRRVFRELPGEKGRKIKTALLFTSLPRLVEVNTDKVF